MRVDLSRSLRRLRPSQFSGSRRRRADADLTFAAEASLAGPPLLLDTCVYIDILEGTAPVVVDRLLQARTCIHLSLVLGELSHNFGRLDPNHPHTREHLAELEAVIHDIPPHRIDQDISAGVVLEAGILAGLVYRLGGFQPGQETSALVDTALYLQSLETGCVVLTANLRDFDFMQQILPAGRVLFYRKQVLG